MKLIKNAMIVVPEGHNGLIRSGYIRIDGNRIVEIDTMDKLTPEKQAGAEIIDAKGKIAIPGFVSTHSHLYSAVVRSLPHAGYDDVDFSFVSWMDRFWFKMLEDKVNPKDVYAGTLINCIENIKHGYTTTSDTTEGSYALPGALFEAGRAAKESGIRGVMSFETTGRISPENAKLGLKENIDFIEHCRKNDPDGRIQGVIGVHTTYTCSGDLIQECRAEATRLKAGLQMHLADDRWHSFDSTLKYGKRCLKWLEDLGFLGPDVLFFHCSYMNELLDPEIMKHYGCNISHQPVSNASFGFWPNMIPFIKAGVNVSLGTDGQTQSMFENMRAAQMIHRIRYEELELLPDKQMFEMATINGARSLHMEDQIGTLEVGKKADIVLLKNNSPVPVFENNVMNFVVTVADAAHVDTVIIDGNKVVEGGEYLLMDEEEVRAKCQEQAVDFWKRNNWPTP
ncbi:MAG: amidohydrolase family protein [Oscillospiraceae bacterium]|nr:amidohydrolase family protein [Oscillospiraceae bacterium]